MIMGNNMEIQQLRFQISRLELEKKALEVRLRNEKILRALMTLALIFNVAYFYYLTHR